MLSKKLLSDGVTLDAASATSGTTMEAVRAAAVTALSLNELWTTIILLDPPMALTLLLLLLLTANGLKKVDAVFWVNGIAMETAQVVEVAIDDASILSKV